MSRVPKNILILLTIFLLNVLFLEVVTRYLVSRIHPPKSHSAYFDIKYEIASIKGNPKKKAILFLGDSFIGTDISSDLLIALLGSSFDIRNLGSPGNTPKMSLALLNKYLKENHNPNIIFFDVAQEFLKKALLMSNKMN